MNRLFIFFSALAIAFSLTSCDNKVKPDESESYPLAILINEGGYHTPIDMIGYNEDALELEGTSMSGANEMPPMGEFHGIFMDNAGNGYPLLSNYDMMPVIDMSRFKVTENNILTDLSNPVAMTLAGSNMYVLNDPDTSAYISVYSTIAGYKLIAKVPVSNGGSALYVDNDFMYVAGKTGIEIYGHTTHKLEKNVVTPAEPKYFMVTNLSYITVSCPGYGLCTFDIPTQTISDSIEVPVGPSGQMYIGKDINDILTFTDTEVCLTNITSKSHQIIYTGKGITGVGRSANSKYTYIAVDGGTKHLVYNDKREKLSEFSTPAGSYNYIFTKRIIYND